jgi:hypothetical protein
MAGSMAPRGVTKERAAEYKGHMTFAVAMACIVAAIGGSIFGYDIGISGTHRMTYVITPSVSERMSKFYLNSNVSIYYLYAKSIGKSHEIAGSSIS